MSVRAKTKTKSRAVAITRPRRALAPLQIKITDNPVVDMLNAIAVMSTQRNVDPRKMREVMDIQLNLMRMKAEREFAMALLSAESEIPEIRKDSKGHNSNYAKYEHMSRVVDPIIRRHGFIPSFGMADSTLPNHYRIVCRLYHVGGHYRDYFIDLPPDDVGPRGEKNKTPTHAASSVTTYGRRILEGMIFNIKFIGMDDDGNQGRIGPVSPAQLKELNDLIIKVGGDIGTVCNVFELDRLEDLPATKFADAMRRLAEYGRRNGVTV